MFPRWHGPILIFDKGGNWNTWRKPSSQVKKK